MSRKWVYGKQEWKTYERGQENCYLMTNGLGGFSSMTMTGSVTRNDHAFFMACTKAPNNRFNMVHRLAEKLETGGREHVLSSQKFADGKVEDGYRYLSEFSYEDTPVWRFHVNGVEIVKEAAMKNGGEHDCSYLQHHKPDTRKGTADCYTVLSVCLKRKRT